MRLHSVAWWFGDIYPITAQGRLVVCGSILAGVAIIPAQAASLVEAIVDFQGDQDRGPSGAKGSGREARPLRTREAVRGDSFALRRRGKTALPMASMEEAGAMENPVAEWSFLEAEAACSADAEGRCCLRCQATEHRDDASFCWSCGSRV